MPRTPRALGLLAAAASAAALGTPAHAAVMPVCRQVSVGFHNVLSVCVNAGAGADGTTVAPYVTVGCAIGETLACAIDPVAVGRTGFVPNPGYPLPNVDPATGTVQVYAGTLGWVWVDGIEAEVVTGGFCVGDPDIC